MSTVRPWSTENVPVKDHFATTTGGHYAYKQRDPSQPLYGRYNSLANATDLRNICHVLRENQNRSALTMGNQSTEVRDRYRVAESARTVHLPQLTIHNSLRSNAYARATPIFRDSYLTTNTNDYSGNVNSNRGKQFYGSSPYTVWQSIESHPVKRPPINIGSMLSKKAPKMGESTYNASGYRSSMRNVPSAKYSEYRSHYGAHEQHNGETRLEHQPGFDGELNKKLVAHISEQRRVLRDGNIGPAQCE